MSPRHTAQHTKKNTFRHRLITGFTVLTLGAGAAVLIGSFVTAEPSRPQLTKTVADPAMLSADGQPATPLGDRDPRGSRASRSAAPKPSTPAATPTRSAVPKPTTKPAPPPTTRPPATTKPPVPPPPPAGGGNATYAQQVLNLTNAERSKAGCPALTLNSKLSAAAQGHSQDMATNDYFDHTGKDGSSPWDRAHAAGYPNPSGENIALGYQTPQEVMAAWMASTGHRENILNCDSHEMGLGYVDDPGRGPLWTQMFGFG